MVVASSARRGAERALSSFEASIKKPVIAGSATVDKTLEAGSASNGSGAGIGFAGFRMLVAVGHITHFRERSGAESLTNAGKAFVDLGRRVGFIEFGDELLGVGDGMVESEQDVDRGPGDTSVGVGEFLRRLQLRRAAWMSAARASTLRRLARRRAAAIWLRERRAP